jgi:PAS domain S-box-containing protein
MSITAEATVPDRHASVGPTTAGHGTETDHRRVFLSLAPAEPYEWRLAVGAVILLGLGFALAAPFARMRLPAVPAFIPIYQSAVVVGDFVTAIMLFGQFAILRSRALLALASGYLFTALIAVVFALTFPGLFSATGLLGADQQSTAWLYMFWHGGFPLAALAYGLLKRSDGASGVMRRPARAIIPWAVVAVLGVVIGLTALATSGSSALPALMDGSRSMGMLTVVAVSVWALGLLALVVLWVGRPHCVLDIWLMVVMCAWLFDVGLSAILIGGRFDLGYYAGRIYGLLAASFVLAVMLLETTKLYGRLAVAATRLSDYAGTLEARVRERTLELERANAEERRAHRDALENARKLEAARSTNERIFETSLDLILVTDRKGRFEQVSPSAMAILGYSPEELIGRGAAEILYPDDLEATRVEMRQARRGRHMRNFETRYVHKSGRIVTLAWTGVWSAPERQYFFTGRDMTERIAAEEQLHQAQKMEAVGQLTGGVAHDFNNLLGVVVGNLDLLRERLAEDADSAELLEEALGAALRGADVTRQLLAFSRRQPLQPKLVEPNETVSGMSKLLSRAIGEQIQVRLHLPEKAVWSVLIDPAQLESAILNLAVNARDAMPNGGTLTIETANLSFDAQEADAHVECSAGDYVMIAVSDTGSGMPPEIVARVFEPFFSTKGVGKGTGLGLSMVYGFVKQSGGNAKIYSEVGIGTTIRLYLPRAAAEAKPQYVAPPTAVPSRGGETILVVEDNEAMRRLALRQLRELGYETLDASNASEALVTLASDRMIDLLFTDIVMPGGMDGHELARRAREMRPDIKILFTSGFTAAAASATIAVELADRLISKPFRKTELASRIRLIIDSPAADSDREVA